MGHNKDTKYDVKATEESKNTLKAYFLLFKAAWIPSISQTTATSVGWLLLNPHWMLWNALLLEVMRPVWKTWRAGDKAPDLKKGVLRWVGTFRIESDLVRVRGLAVEDVWFQIFDLLHARRQALKNDEETEVEWDVLLHSWVHSKNRMWKKAQTQSKWLTPWN